MDLSMFYIDIVYFTGQEILYFTFYESGIQFFCIRYSQTKYVSKQS